MHGSGWRLVTDGPSEGDLDPELVDWFSSIGGTVVALDGQAPELTAWLQARGVRWALQRPDFHLYGAAADLAGAADLLADLRERLIRTETQ